MSIAYVLVQCLIGREMEVLRSLLETNFVKEGKSTFGYYDILVKIEAPSEKQIENVVTKKIRKIEYVITTTTLSVIKEQG
uniref:Transcriptional regulator n=1 Tax=uncultured marine thaumarchaeote KM3_73_E02 TaxID=1456267 RepID=A0A075HLY5_9ARCH|nr:transcriptional regulator [uncultured marine thaumarchaeote KM3_73_E02]